MNSLLRGTVVAAALLATAGLASAQTSPVAKDSSKDGTVGMRSSEPAKEAKLTAAQKAMIFTAIRRSGTRVTPPPRDLSIGVGVTIPSSAELFELPEAAVKDVPDAKPYKFTIVNDTLILVDPTTMQVVATARQ
jgi:hypothetical protein